jgi:hypothetical protein
MRGLNGRPVGRTTPSRPRFRSTVPNTGASSRSSSASAKTSSRAACAPSRMGTMRSPTIALGLQADEANQLSARKASLRSQGLRRTTSYSRYFVLTASRAPGCRAPGPRPDRPQAPWADALDTATAVTRQLRRLRRGLQARRLARPRSSAPYPSLALPAPSHCPPLGKSGRPQIPRG